MANKLTEPYWLAWLRWHAYRRFKPAPRYRTMWAFRQYVRRCPPGGVLVDCGANVGDVTRLFLEKGFTVYAFEPDPVAAAELRRRLGGNPLLHLREAAVAAAPGKQPLYRASDASLGHTQSSSLFLRSALHDEVVETEVIDLFAFIGSLDRPVNVLKLDIEGAEAEILERMLDERTYADIDRIFVETHESISPDIAASIQRSRRRIAEERITNIDLEWA